MSDEDLSPPPANTGDAYRLVFLKIDSEGVISISGSVRSLTTKIYDRRTAIRFAAHEIQEAPVGVAEQIVAVVGPNGRALAVLAASGKPVRAALALRTKRALSGLLPNDIQPRRRTSRTPVDRLSKGSEAKRRTSRRA